MSARWPRPTAGSHWPWPAWRSGRGQEILRARRGRARPPRRTTTAEAAGCARLRPPDQRAAVPPEPAAARTGPSPRQATRPGEAGVPPTGSSGGLRCRPSGCPRPRAASGSRSTCSRPGPRFPRRPGTGYRRRRAQAPRAPAAQQLADRSPPGIRRPPAQTKSRSDHTERAGALEGMCLAAVHGKSTRTRGIDDALHQAGLADAGFPSITSTDALPSLRSRTAAAARASSASRPTSPPAEDMFKGSPTPAAESSCRSRASTLRPRGHSG